MIPDDTPCMKDCENTPCAWCLGGCCLRCKPCEERMIPDDAIVTGVEANDERFD